jgi:opacity protein-like surface antigen
MRKALGLLVLLLAVSPVVLAQEHYPRLEIFGGYSYFRSDQFANRESLNAPGYAFSLAGNVSKHVGLVAEVSRHHGDVTFPNLQPNPEVEATTTTFLFGPRFSTHGEGVSLFGHLLLGGLKTSAEGFGSETDFALAVGGGIEFAVSERVAVRAIQLDYLPSRGEDRWAHNFRAQVGLVFKFK